MCERQPVQPPTGDLASSPECALSGNGTEPRQPGLFVLILERGGGMGGIKKGTETSIGICCPLTRSEPATQEGALTGNPTSNLWVCGLTPNKLSYTGQGCSKSFDCDVFTVNFKWTKYIESGIPGAKRFCNLQVGNHCSALLLRQSFRIQSQTSSLPL